MAAPLAARARLKATEDDHPGRLVALSLGLRLRMSLKKKPMKRLPNKGKLLTKKVVLAITWGAIG